MYAKEILLNRGSMALLSDYSSLRVEFWWIGSLGKIIFGERRLIEEEWGCQQNQVDLIKNRMKF